MSPNPTRPDDDTFRRYAAEAIGPLGRLATLLCGDRHFAEDLVQISLIRIYRVWPRIHQTSTVDAYARQVLLRCWLTERRRAWRRREHRDGQLPDRPDDRPDPALALESIDVRERLRRALAEVPPRQRAALVLRYWAQQSVAETAAIMRCSEGTVKSRTARGLVTLREAMARQGIVKELRNT